MLTSTLSKVVKLGLYIYGIQPYLPTTLLFRLYWIVALSVAQVFQYGYVVVNVDTDDFPEFMDGVSSAMASSLFFIKLGILWTNQQTFSNILQMMSADWRNNASNHHNSCVMMNSAKLAHRASRSIVGLQVIAVFFYTFGVLAANVGNPEKLEPYARELVLKMELPFNISTNSIYSTVTIVQFFHLLLVACGITVINSLLVTLILHVGGQIDILRTMFSKGFSKGEQQQTEEITTQSLVTQHQRIISFSNNIDTLYTYIALMMLLSDTLIICCIGYIIATSIGMPNSAAILVKSVLFYITMNLEAFIYCFCGEYLSAKSKTIGDAAYESFWCNLPTKNNRIVSFVILRAQKRLTITSGRITDLSLELFTSVVKASASYLSVLLAMY